MSPLSLFFDNGLRNVVPPGTIATHGSPQDNPQAGTPYTNSFGSPVAVQPLPRIRRVRRNPKDFQDQLESLDIRVPMASTADKVGPIRVGAGGAALQLRKFPTPSIRLVFGERTHNCSRHAVLDPQAMDDGLQCGLSCLSYTCIFTQRRPHTRGWSGIVAKQEKHAPLLYLEKT
jgi:hypothetical protein